MHITQNIKYPLRIFNNLPLKILSKHNKRTHVVFGQHGPRKTPLGKTNKIYIYIYIYGDLKANATTSKYTRNLIQSNLILKLLMEPLKLVPAIP